LRIGQIRFNRRQPLASTPLRRFALTRLTPSRTSCSVWAG
jgi:hypothetical protein